MAPYSSTLAWKIPWMEEPGRLQFMGFPRQEYALLFGRKAMTNLESILKSRDIIVPTKVHLVKTMVFPVVMYGCGVLHSSTLAWKIPRTEEPGRLQSMGSQRVGHD